MHLRYYGVNAHRPLNACKGIAMPLIQPRTVEFVDAGPKTRTNTYVEH